jgi:hypothetical protein
VKNELLIIAFKKLFKRKAFAKLDERIDNTDAQGR